MPTKAKFTTEELLSLIKEGKTQAEAAAILGVSESAVSQRLKKKNVAVNRNVALFSAGRIIDRQLSTAHQLEIIRRPELKLVNFI